MKPRVLIVDDSLTVRMDLQEAFEAAGYATLLCATAAAAREALAQGGADGPLPVGIVVLDVLLPDADGVEFLQEIKADPATAEIPVLLLSTEARVRDRVRGVTTGADDYVGKPYERDYLIARASELLRARQPEPRTFPVILLIDDSATFRGALRIALEGAGYTVLEAESGEEGLHLAVSSRPDAVVVDAGLPGIDGAEVVRRMKTDTVLRRTPCLLLTASEEASYELRALEAGADTFVQKGEDTELILLRLAATLRSAATPAAVEPAASLFGLKRILAVDDSVTFLEELAAQMRQEGYDVVQATSGEQALDLLAVQPVDCILLDLIMPTLSGHETCRRIKGFPAWRDIPLVMLTAREDQEAMIASFNSGADDYIPKSSDFEVVKSRLRAQLRRKHFEDENRRIREELLHREREAAEARAAQELAETRTGLLSELERANKELEAFCYSVSHDLRGPLRSIEGFSAILLEDYADRLDDEGCDHLRRVQAAAHRMSQLIDDLLWLSRVTRGKMNAGPVNLSDLARSIASDLKESEPDRDVTFVIADDLMAYGDAHLLRAALENLLGNAWKFTSRRPSARIELGVMQREGECNGECPPHSACFVRDNGAGFDMSHVGQIFEPFRRLHAASEFEGSGIGLATVQRIIHRHGGQIWAEGEVGKGATFYFTLGLRDENGD